MGPTPGHSWIISKEGNPIMAPWKFAFFAVAAVFSGDLAYAADPSEPLPAPPTGHFIIQEELWTDLADEPGQHMERAREAYLKVDAADAAAELRKAATYLKISAAQAAAGTKRTLLRSAMELEMLAKRVETGTVNSVGELDAATARALHALAHHHCVLAEKSWVQRETRCAGKQMRAAADNLERAAARTGETLRSATRAVARDVRVISGKLVEGTGFVVDEVGRGFTSLGKQVETVGKGIEPHPTTAAAAEGAPQKR
jgi:hypothetical protein